MLLIAFVAIYGITYQRTMEDIRKQLQKTAFQLPGNQGDIPPIGNNGYFQTNKGDEGFMPISITFWIEVNNTGELIGFFNPNVSNLTQESVIELNELVTSKNSDFGTFQWSDGDWAYQVVEVPHGTRLVFMEITFDVGSLGCHNHGHFFH